MISIKIDGREHKVEEGLTILEACGNAGIKIPTLCHRKDVNDEGTCGICAVEVKGYRTLPRACITKAAPGMEIKTASEAVRLARKTNMELILAGHPQDCLSCRKNDNCELRQLAHELGITETRFNKITRETPADETSPSVLRDPSKCIMCRRCVSVCANMQNVSAINVANRGDKAAIAAAHDAGLGETACANCGQCALVCPTGALMERPETEEVWRAINDPDKYVVVQTAPAVRVAIGEEFGLEAGKSWTGKMAAALRRLGFDKVFDTQFTADLTIMEEGHELLARIANKGTLPLITSCSPGWVKFAEHFFPNALEHVSSCKSPQQMFGALAKTYYAQKLGVDPRKMVVVSIMPCVAKKFEAKRPEMNGAFHYWQKKMGLKPNENFQDVDHVLSTRELGRMIKEAGIGFAQLPDEDFDKPLGISTGAAVIFGATGGVMEAALRTAYEVVTGKKLESVDFKAVRGLEGIKHAEVDLNGTKVKVAVAHTLKNARKLLEEIQSGKSPYHFIEIMACEGGCLGGGGQPYTTSKAARLKRAEAIYNEDAGFGIRKSHENPAVQDIYKEFLVKPLGELSHHLLHTEYTKRDAFPKRPKCK